MKYYSLKMGTMRRAVFDFIASRGEKGCIQSDVLAHFASLPGKKPAYPSVTARFSELVECNRIERTGEFRIGRNHNQEEVMRVKLPK